MKRTTTRRRAVASPATEAAAIAPLPGGPLPYTLRHSPRARGLRVVIHPERGVVVTVPATRSGRSDGERRAVEFLGQREPWVRRHLARHADVRAELAARGGARDGGSIRLEGTVMPIRVVPAVVGTRRSTVARFDDELVIHRADRDKRPDAAVIEEWLRDLARIRIDAAVADHAEALGVIPRSITIRDPRSRWGSASQRGRVSLSWRLVLAPREALETVVIHELAHLRIFGHGPTFWALVASRRPDHQTWRRWLHDHATELHGALG
jgi:predicted metal-dependent hydrolase